VTDPTAMAGTFDVLLVTLLLVLGIGALVLSGAFRSVILFISFGLVMALAWVRLGATDLAIAEAAIGAAIVGGLLVDAVAQFGDPPRTARSWRARSVPFAAAFVGAGGTFVGLLHLLPSLRDGSSQVAPLVAQVTATDGPSHPVTAVLLDFRALDTLLEVAVLLVAAAAALALVAPERLAAAAHEPVPDRGSQLVRGLSARLLPITVLVGIWLLAAGTSQPGGAFQAGSVLAAALLLAHFAGTWSLLGLPGLVLRALLVCGVVVFALAGVAMLVLGDGLLQWPRGAATAIIVAVELVVTVSIAVTLATMFLVAREAGAARREQAADAPALRRAAESGER
jgi:multisubunit Na+/H+ antiporter MnhB subunit